MREKLILSCLISFLLIGDFASNIYYGKGSITWPSLILIIILIFALTGEKITRIVINKDGFTIEQQVEKLKQDFYQLSSFGVTGNKNELVFLMDHITQSTDIGYKLLMYRIIARTLVRRFCKELGIPTTVSGDVPRSFTDMINDLRTFEDRFDAKLLNDLEEIKENTAFFEWGSTPLPSDLKIQNTLHFAPYIIAQLISKLKD